jgi:hypothetical protein
MRIWVRKSLDAEREQLQQIEVFLAKNDAIMRRCGEGVLRELLVSRRRNMQTRREQIARNRAIGADALALLDGVTFENDPITGDSMRRLMRL